MKIKKPLGNNAVLTEDKNGIEQVAIGNGIGFKKRAGDEVEQSKIQNLYIVKDEDTKNSDVEKAIQNIQPDNIVLASKIIKAGEKELGYRCNDSILLALADHLDFAITRAKNNTFFSTPLEWDIRVIYPKEYEFSLKAIQYISDYCKIVIPNQEAPFIALHFINSQINESNSLNDMTETILYEGNGFREFVEVGDYVHVGDKLIEFDKAELEDKGYNLVTPVIVTNEDSYSNMNLVAKGKIKSGDVIFGIE